MKKSSSKNSQFVNLGAGDPVDGWLNLDPSPYFMMPRFVHHLLFRLGITQRSEKYLNYHYQYFKFSEKTPLPFINNSVEAVYLSHVLEHFSVKEIEAVLKECHRILVKEGVVRIVLPDLEARYEAVKKKNKILWLSLSSQLLTLPEELLHNRWRAVLEAYHGFPSFHKSMIFKDKIHSYYKKDWRVVTSLKHLQSEIEGEKLQLVESPLRTRNATIFELIKK